MRSREKKKRRQMLAAALGILLVVTAVQLLVASGQSTQLWRLQCALLLGFYAAAALACAAACLWGDYFNRDGTMQRGVISAVLVAIVCTGQLAAGAAAFLYETIEFDRTALLQAESAYATAREALQQQANDPAAAPGPLVAGVDFLDEDGSTEAIVAVEGEPVGDTYRFPVQGGEILVHISTRQLGKSMGRAALSIFSTLVGMGILAVELVLFATRAIDGEGRQSGDAAGKEEIPFPWLRQVAFLYFMAAKLCASFLPARALRLAGDMAQPGVAAGLAGSAELLFTCLGLLLGSRLMGKKGWRPVLCLGFGLTAASSLLGGLAGQFTLYFASRCVSGLGYGLAWMTLRGLARVQRHPQGALVQLICGIYAGMNFGVALGSLLAGGFGEGSALFAAAAVGALAILPLRMLPNALAAQGERMPNSQAGGGGAVALAAFCLLVVLPTGLLAAFQGYYLPIYIPTLGGSTIETGAIQLAYGVCIVYLGPGIQRFFAQRMAAGKQVVVQLALLGGALALFGVVPGYAALVAAVLVVAVAESFGAGAQNAEFYTTRLATRLGGARALTVFSLGKKLAESFGPFVFGFVASAGQVALLGAVAIAAGGGYALVLRRKRGGLCGR